MLGLVMAMAALGSSAATASATNCPYISAGQLAKAFGLKHATAYHVVGPEVLGNAAYRFSLCRAVAWSGSTPTNEKQAQAKVDAGQGAGIVINTEEEVPGSQEEVEAWHRGYAEQTEAFHVAAMHLVHVFHGKILAPPAFHAQSDLAYELVQNGKLGLTGIWEDESQYAYVTIGIIEGKHKPGRKSFEKIAATVVGGFGL